MTQIENRMETRLGEIRGLLWDIGARAESALKHARQALFTRDAELAYRTILDDHPLDRKSRRLDASCHDFTGRFLPGAGVQREMTATLRINAILERIGDHAVAVCRQSLRLESELPDHFRKRIDRVAEESLSMLGAARESFRDGNAERTLEIIHSSRLLENRMDRYYEELFSEDERLDAAPMMIIFVVFNIYKRVADQAAKICEQSVYTARGHNPSPEVCRMLLVGESGSSLPGAMADAANERFTPAVSIGAFGPELTESELVQCTVLVGLDCSVHDFVDDIPFHTSVKNLAVAAELTDTERMEALMEQLAGLVKLVSGDLGFHRH